MENIKSLGSFGTKFQVASWQNHLVKISETQVTILVMTMITHKISNFFLFNLLFELILRVITYKLVNVFVIDAQLTIHCVPASDFSKKVVTFKCFTFSKFLAKCFNMKL